jgi:hypothetical protein
MRSGSAKPNVQAEMTEIKLFLVHWSPTGSDAVRVAICLPYVSEPLCHNQLALETYGRVVIVAD